MLREWLKRVSGINNKETKEGRRVIWYSAFVTDPRCVRFGNTGKHGRAHIDAVLVVPDRTIVTAYRWPSKISPNSHIAHAAGEFASCGGTWIQLCVTAPADQ